MSGKFALIIANTEYTDPGLSQLTAPGRDAEDFARVLRSRDICAFDDVNVLLNQPEYMVRGAIDEFFDQKRPDDLLVLYFSGHGVRDELGALHLAVKNTNRFRLRSTAIKSDFIREAMDQSRSKRQVLIMDCCNSGAFSQGTKAATGVSIGTASAFEAGYGRVILTASDSTQFAWEGDKVIGDTDNSLFTHFLVQGLEGEADLDGDGHITVDELYDYAYEKVKFATPKQTPSKFSSKQQGEIVLRQSMRIEDIKPVTLPDELIEATDDSRTFVREGAVQQLEKLLKGRNLGLARTAREVLERIEREDDSRRVSQAATQVLEPIRQAEKVALQKAEEERLAAEKVAAEQKAKEEAERSLAEQKAEEERIAREKEKEERKAREELERKVREQVEAEWKAREEEKRLAAEKVEVERKVKAEERLAKQKAERESAEKNAREKDKSKDIEDLPLELDLIIPRDTSTKELPEIHLILPASEETIGRKPLENEGMLFEESVYRTSWPSRPLGKLIMTDFRLIFWDQNNDSNSFEIHRSNLLLAKFKLHRLRMEVSIHIPSGQNYSIGVRGISPDKLIEKIKFFLQ